MAKILLSFSFVFLFLVSHSSQDPVPNPNANPKSSPTPVHAELTNFGFPIGLLPNSVLSYTLNQTSGDFSVDLGDACKITLPPDNYLATYSKKVTGKIVKGRIAEIDGIRVWAFFKWWSITGIRSSGDNLVFEVGMVTAKYPTKNFDASPACEGRHSSS
ncbi:uncharacterized protein LOC107431854 [Ziziphus jujuba]|uniref:Uncharacterized protein LOC107431854 n=1 Tax=Ziziphus jujuba TaxID=326968 RepID=A0A6P4B7Y8_ZIZJJ|nr:uncharacterized protein LOC107431854 [Ziziphus jujuba]XP_060668762.1 uncharacterized protein LOC107431854 [Ziziphus jujuba]XP_060668763.1 uncharacterized protein LOC107431854 [Ziziphus jujuba]